MTPDEELQERSGVSQQSPSDDPRWDYRKCRCENNGDYCEYCLSLLDEEDEDGRTQD